MDLSPDEFSESRPCAWCRGTGIDRNADPDQKTYNGCGACGGSGSVLLQRPVEMCIFCRGTGGDAFYNPKEREDRCLMCFGKGWKNDFKPVWPN